MKQVLWGSQHHLELQVQSWDNEGHIVCCALSWTRCLQCISAANSFDQQQYQGSSSSVCSGGNRTKETDRKNGMVAWETLRLQLQNSAYSGKSQWTCGHTVKDGPRRWTKRNQTYLTNTIRCLLECLQSRWPRDARKQSSRSIITTPGDNEQVGENTFHQTKRDNVDGQGGTTGCAPRQQSQEEDTKRTTQPLGGRTSGEGQDNKTNLAQLLMATGKSLDWLIHHGVHNLPTK